MINDRILTSNYAKILGARTLFIQINKPIIQLRMID